MKNLIPDTKRTLKITVAKGKHSIVYSINEPFYSITLKSLASLFSFQNGLDLYHWKKKMKLTDSIQIWRKMQHFFLGKSLRKESVQKVKRDNHQFRKIKQTQCLLKM